MAERPPIQETDLRYLKNALISIGIVIEQPDVTGIIRDELTGRIIIESSEDQQPLSPLEILEKLKEIPFYPEKIEKDKSFFHGETSANIRTVASLGALALDTLTEEAKPLSKTRLKRIQVLLRQINRKAVPALAYSDLEKPSAGAAFVYINSVVNQNPRTHLPRPFAERFEH